MTSKWKYLAQREWIDYCTQKTIYIKEMIEKMWFLKKKTIHEKIFTNISKTLRKIISS
jgi:hypothetical protein